jgi:hypothetical protein
MWATPVATQDRSVDVFGSFSGVVRPQCVASPREDCHAKASRRGGEAKEENMGTMSLEQVLAEAKRLSQEEQRQLRDTLDRWLQHDRPEDRLEEALTEAGLLRARRPWVGDTAPHPSFTPIAVRGQPVSETLIEERR